MGTYGDFPGVTVNTNGSVTPSAPENTLYLHIDNADTDLLPLKLAVEENWPIYIYGPDERREEIAEVTRELEKDFTQATGLVVGDRKV